MLEVVSHFFPIFFSFLSTSLLNLMNDGQTVVALTHTSHTDQEPDHASTAPSN